MHVPGAGGRGRIPISIVVIGRNEHAHLGDCLRAVRAAAARVGGAEVVYVDSASTDTSVAIARALGVRVVALPSGLPLSPSAGRYAGFHSTSGDLVMFVDGDTVLDEDWFRLAIPFFEQQDVGGIAGFLDDVDDQCRVLPYVGTRSAVVRPITRLRGSGFYRRAALDRAGTFNPYLKTEEEAELGLRLRKAGWHLLHVPEAMGCHRRGMRRHTEILREVRLGRCQSLGLTWRYACREGLGWRFCRERLGPSMAFAMMAVIISAFGIAWIAGETRAAIGLWLLPAWLAAVAIRKRSLRGPLDYVVTHVLTLYGFVAGAVAGTLPDPQRYPIELIAPNRS